MEGAVPTAGKGLGKRQKKKSDAKSVKTLFSL
jgi:hypothetical protein